nr:uncharacterized protein LOC128678054 [Plodia interpunctella]
MSAIAQKLCEEIVDPNLNSKVASSKTAGKKSSTGSNRSKYNGRSTHSIVIKKEREVNKIVPQGSNKTVINKFRSKETVLKKTFVDTGVNTVVSGSLRCDNDCITDVRKRDKFYFGSVKSTCKCSTKRSCKKGTPKLIQTDYYKKPYALLDKACTQCVETASFGQVTPSCFKNKSGDLKPIIKEPKLSFKESFYKMITPRKQSHVSQQSFPEPQLYVDEYSSISKEPQRNKVEKYGSPYHNLSYRTCKRWALSQYPVRGPDF